MFRICSYGQVLKILKSCYSCTQSGAYTATFVRPYLENEEEKRQ